MSTKKNTVGLGIGLVIIKLPEKSAGYWKAVLPPVMGTFGYTARIEKVQGLENFDPRPIVMVLHSKLPEALSNPNIIRDLRGPCKYDQRLESLGTPMIELTTETSLDDFIELVVREGIWIPANIQELETAIHILGLQKRVCHPL